MLFVITSQFIPSNTVQFPGFRLNRNKNSTRTAIVHNNSRTSDAQKWVKQSYMVVFEKCDYTNGIERGGIQFFRNGMLGDQFFTKIFSGFHKGNKLFFRRFNGCINHFNSVSAGFIERFYNESGMTFCEFQKSPSVIEADYRTDIPFIVFPVMLVYTPFIMEQWKITSIIVFSVDFIPV